MELKIVCQCGQKYKFDVEPVNGRMPFAVKCPICGIDGTTTANTLLASRAAAAPVLATAAAPPPYQAPPPFTAPPPPAPVQAAPPAIAPMAGGLKINREAPPATVAATISNMPPVTRDNAPPAIGAQRPFAAAATANPPKPTSFGMGVAGAAIGALAGSLVYFLVIHASGIYGFFGLKLLAIGVGGLAGWLANLMGKGEGSKELGGLAAVLTIAGVLGAQYFVALGWCHSIRDEAFKEAVVEAKRVVDAVPTGSDAEIRNYLAKNGTEDGDTKAAPDAISEDDVKDFHDSQLPRYQALASSKLTEQEYGDNHKKKTSESQDEEDSDDSNVKILFMAIVFSRSSIFGLIAAGTLAFKLSANN